MVLGALTLAYFLVPLDPRPAANQVPAVANTMPPHLPPLPGKAKAVIHIFAQGAPSHVDTWDYKPMLTKMNNKTIGGDGVAIGSPFKFSPYGQSRLEVSELFATTAAHAHDLPVIHSMHTDIPPHAVAT